MEAVPIVARYYHTNPDNVSRWPFEKIAWFLSRIGDTSKHLESSDATVEDIAALAKRFGMRGPTS